MISGFIRFDYIHVSIDIMQVCKTIIKPQTNVYSYNSKNFINVVLFQMPICNAVTYIKYFIIISCDPNRNVIPEKIQKSPFSFIKSNILLHFFIQF